MKYAILSDIHSNREALEAVLARLREYSPDAFLCLGDIVGYGADPSACLSIVRSLTDNTVRGNHDAAAVDLTDLRYFNPAARHAALWTEKTLEVEEKEYLTSLPLVKITGGMTLFHSSLDSPEEWGYITSTADARASFRLLRTGIGFFGHTHLPVVLAEAGGEISACFEDRVELNKEIRYLVNVGSVGQPRDRDPRASAGIYDSARQTVEIIRVEYPYEKTQEKIVDAGLPPFLAERLAEGR